MIYILAQGAGSRWTLGARNPNSLPCEHKQLIPINGEPNLFRTIRILEDMGRNDYIVIAKGLMFTDEQIDSLPNKIKTLRVPGNILDGIGQLLHNVTENSIFLLGDTVFSRWALQQILEPSKKYTLYGRNGHNKHTGKVAKEIFAVSVTSEFIPLVKFQLEHEKILGTKLWYWYEQGNFSGNWSEIDDWTDDVDSPEEFEQFFSILERLARGDE